MPSPRPHSDEEESDQGTDGNSGRRAGTPMPSPRPHSDEEESDQDISNNSGRPGGTPMPSPRPSSDEEELRCRECGAEMPTKETLKLHNCDTRITSSAKRRGVSKVF